MSLTYKKMFKVHVYWRLRILIKNQVIFVLNIHKQNSNCNQFYRLLFILSGDNERTTVKDSRLDFSYYKGSNGL